MIDPGQGRQQREQARRQLELEGKGSAKQLPRISGGLGEGNTHGGMAVQKPANHVAVQDVLMPTLARINDRIFAYEQKLKSWKEFVEKTASFKLDEAQQERIDACKDLVQEIIQGYNTLHERLLGEQVLSSARLLAAGSLFSLEKKDIDYLEGDCPRILSGGGEGSLLATSRSKTREAQEQALQAAWDEGDYARVISEYEQIPLAEGEQPPFEIAFLYGQALVKEHREEEARQVFTALLERLRQQKPTEKVFRLMRLIGDLNFGLGDYEAARKGYESIRQRYTELGVQDEWAQQQLAALDSKEEQGQEVAAYAALLRDYLAYKPDRDGYKVVLGAQQFLKQYPYSPVASNVDQLLKAATGKADDWFNRFLRKLDELEQKKDFQEALLRIEQIPREILPLQQQGILSARSEELETAEAIALETERLLRQQALQETWNKAMAHLEAKEYDLAIEGFTSLLDSSYGERARSRIREAVELAAREDRRRAAELFVRANRTHDLESRKKLLLASRRLLKEILVKYPQSELINKVKRNLIRIEEEIRAIDPALLDVPQPLGEGSASADVSSRHQGKGDNSLPAESGHREKLNMQE